MVPTITKLPSGKYRVQVRKAGIYRAATFPTKTEAKTWGAAIEGQAYHIAAGGFAPPPKDATLADLIAHYEGIFGLTLSAQERSDLQNYLRSL